MIRKGKTSWSGWGRSGGERSSVGHGGKLGACHRYERNRGLKGKEREEGGGEGRRGRRVVEREEGGGEGHDAYTHQACACTPTHTHTNAQS